MSIRLKKNDRVKVLSGKDKNKEGKIIRRVLTKNRDLVTSDLLKITLKLALLNKKLLFTLLKSCWSALNAENLLASLLPSLKMAKKSVSAKNATRLLTNTNIIHLGGVYFAKITR